MDRARDSLSHDGIVKFYYVIAQKASCTATT
jgi:hypothetical protein